MKNLKTHLAVLLLSTLGLFTGAHGQAIPSIDAATLNQGRPSGAPYPAFTAHAGAQGKPFNRLNRRPYAWQKNENTDRAAIAASAAQSLDQEIVLHSFGSMPNGANPYSGLFRGADGDLYGTAFGGGASGAGVVYRVNASGKETALYSFTGGADGYWPIGVIRDGAGNLYGTTLLGGSGAEFNGAGVVFMVDKAGRETALYTFTGGADGGYPFAGVVRDGAGNLYGTTSGGGNASGAGVVFKLAPPAQPGGVWTETVLYTFTGGADGAYPNAVIRDGAGNLYGTTAGGGSASGAGVVFELNTAGQEKVLYTFTGGTDGGDPNAGVIRDASGNLYGTTEGGGASGAGVVFMVDVAGQEKLLYTFTGGADGGSPYAGVIRDALGNLYGTTYGGGVSGQGVVFKLDTAAQETVLYAFTGGVDGGSIQAGVIGDAAGNLYGTSFFGGPGGDLGYGVVFKVDTASQYSAVYTFPPPLDGASPDAGVIRDAAGNLYGTASSGGAGNAGVVYEVHVTSQGTRGHQTVLHAFTGGADGSDPQGGLIADAAGNLYGTTAYGGDLSGPACAPSSGCGVVFKLAPPAQPGGAWTETVLYNFTGAPDGAYPIAGVIMDSAGNLYGTTINGGTSGAGAVFKLAPPAQPDGAWTEAVLYSFSGLDGAYPRSGVIMDSANNIYGTTFEGGGSGCGVYGCGAVYKLDPSGNETVLHGFTFGVDGGFPIGGLIFDSAGSLYGTTWSGGPPSLDYPGVVYKIDSSGNFSVLYTFTDFGGSASTLIFDSQGNLYGTTQYGGQGLGDVFELDPTGHQTVLYSFTFADGYEPVAGVIGDEAGHLYGTTLYGGTSGAGVVFVLAPVEPSVSPTSLNFGNVVLGYREKKVVTLQNQGIDPVEIGPITFTAIAGDASQFTDHVFCPANLGPGKSCTIAVIFTPDAVGADAATLNIVTSAPGSPIEVPIAAAGK